MPRDASRKICRRKRLAKQAPTTLTPAQIIAVLRKLEVGERFTYHTGPYLDHPGNRPLMLWLQEPDQQERYAFTQRRIGENASGIGQYDYIAQRVKV